MTRTHSSVRRALPAVIGGAFVVVVAIVAVILIKNMLADSAPPKKQVQQVTLLAPPPPPPPPEQPPPEQKVEEVKVDEPEPQPVPDASDEPAPGADLGVDGDGAGAGDGFGLIGKKNGRSLIGGGGGFGWFASQVQSDLQDQLGKRDDIRKKRYSVKVNLWLESDGRVRNVEMIGSSGSPDLDRELRTALKAITQLSTRPPEELPQPIRLRIASRM